MSDLNLELATMDELIAEIDKRCECFVFSAVLHEKHLDDIITTYIESKGKYYERLGMCTDLESVICSESMKEEK